MYAEGWSLLVEVCLFPFYLRVAVCKRSGLCVRWTYPISLIVLTFVVVVTVCTT